MNEIKKEQKKETERSRPPISGRDHDASKKVLQKHFKPGYFDLLKTHIQFSVIVT